MAIAVDALKFKLWLYIVKKEDLKCNVKMCYNNSMLYKAVLKRRNN